MQTFSHDINQACKEVTYTNKIYETATKNIQNKVITFHPDYPLWMHNAVWRRALRQLKRPIPILNGLN